jgi:acyl-CoA thioesterase I
MTAVLGFLLGAILLSALGLVWIGRQATRLPAGTAAEMLEAGRPEGCIVACLGDSLTHGRVSADWVGMLRERMGPDGFVFLNAGVNGETALELGRRLDPVIECQPDAAVLLIGSNDAMGSFHHGDGLLYQKKGGLPSPPTLAGYSREVEELVGRLKEIPKVAICTLPPLGENPDSEVNRHLAAFNEKLRALADEAGLPLLPLDQRLDSLLQERPAPPERDYRPGRERTGPMIKAIWERYALGIAWDESAARRGLIIGADHIHLGERAGGILADMVESFLRENDESGA